MAAARLLPAVVLPAEVVVAVIKAKRRRHSLVHSACRYLTDHLFTQSAISKPKASSNSSLQALTIAALALPGLVLPFAYAEDDDVNFQYGHYQEGKRNLYSVKNNKNPIEVESLLGKAKISLSDRIKFAFNYTQDTWSGATPITTAPLVAKGNRVIEADTASGLTIKTGASPYITNTELLLNKDFIPLRKNANNTVIGEDPRVVHTLATASPETRKQGDFKLGYEWDEAALDIGGGISIENDYESRFGNINGRWDFNQKLTSVNLGLSYTNSDTSAILDHDSASYISNIALSTFVKMPFAEQIERNGSVRTLRGNRQDWAGALGLTQVLSKEALIETSLAYTHSTGYMENPYKVMTVVFADPASLGADPFYPDAIVGSMQTFLEQRPDERNQLTLGGRYIQHIGMVDAALHLDYRFFHDDWGIDAQTFTADWVQPFGNTWTVTPRVRYYSQDAADFYHPYLISKQAYSKNYDHGKLPANFSSDQRLSGYGALSGGVTINKQFSKAVGLEAGFEYYVHAGSLKLDGGGEGSYSDFNYFIANAALKVNLSALGSATLNEHSSHHADHGAHHGGHAPAGVMFGHMLSKTDAVMVGYRYMFSSQRGSMLHGSALAGDLDIVENGCGRGSDGCRLSPTYMDMSMHMLDMMVAPTDWLNLMLMPQFMDMEMNLRQLDGAPPVKPGGHIHTGTGHATGGVGDTGIYALFKLFGNPMHHLHLGVGVSAPTGDVDIKLRRTHQQDEGYIHYGMQLGSGTWDFKPSLTYTGTLDDWSWGAQLSATKRLEDHNDSGFAFGDIFQSTAWGAYNLTHWLSASVRGVYTDQNIVSGKFKPTQGVVDGILRKNVNPKSGPMDYSSSYGGRYWDIGLGLNAVVPHGDLAGNSLGVEWLQPIETDVNGYQLDRDGALSATWSVAF